MVPVAKKRGGIMLVSRDCVDVTVILAYQDLTSVFTLALITELVLYRYLGYITRTHIHRVSNNKSELMLMRRARACSSSCSQVVLVYLHPFRRNSLFCNRQCCRGMGIPSHGYGFGNCAEFSWVLWEFCENFWINVRLSANA